MMVQFEMIIWGALILGGESLLEVSEICKRLEKQSQPLFHFRRICRFLKCLDTATLLRAK